jgi:hypothetical protein
MGRELQPESISDARRHHLIAPRGILLHSLSVLLILFPLRLFQDGNCRNVLLGNLSLDKP